MTDDTTVGRGGYDINWDEVDENTNPFSLGVAVRGQKLPSTPPSRSITMPSGPVSSSSHSKSPAPSAISNEGHKTKKPTQVVESRNNGSEPAQMKSSSQVSLPTSSTDAVLNKDLSNVDNQSVLNEDASNAGVHPTDAIDITSDNKSKEDEPPMGNQTSHGVQSRRNSNSSAATFDLASGNRSPLPETESALPSTTEEELASLRADKEQLTIIVADMQRCIAEYERSLRQLAEEKAIAEESAKESVIDIISERDQAIEEISTIEKAFGDLHRRFEKSKQIIEGFKTNEESLKKTAQEYQDQLKRQEQKYQALKMYAEQQLTKIAEETERTKRANEDEVTRLRTAIKRYELRIHSLESQLVQKVRENTELTKICDELLSKYGDK